MKKDKENEKCKDIIISIKEDLLHDVTFTPIIDNTNILWPFI